MYQDILNSFWIFIICIRNSMLISPCIAFCDDYLFIARIGLGLSQSQMICLLFHRELRGSPQTVWLGRLCRPIVLRGRAVLALSSICSTLMLQIVLCQCFVVVRQGTMHAASVVAPCDMSARPAKAGAWVVQQSSAKANVLN